MAAGTPNTALVSGGSLNFVIFGLGEMIALVIVRFGMMSVWGHFFLFLLLKKNILVVFHKEFSNGFKPSKTPKRTWNMSICYTE